MALTATMIPALFLRGVVGPTSRRQSRRSGRSGPSSRRPPRTWARRPRSLRDAARTKDLAATEAVAKDFGRQACGTCHQPFRVPPPQQQTPAPPPQPQPALRFVFRP
jgi:hypothetical protein